MKRPRVSVICAVRDGERFLEESLRSILDQGFADLELIAVDDGSTDGTSRILEECAREDRRIRVITQEHRGLPRSLNGALSLAGAELVARQDADDVSLPSRIARQVEYLERHRDVALVGCRYENMDESGSPLWTSRVPVTDGAIRRALLTHNVFPHSGVMFRRDVVRGAGGYDESLDCAQDYDLWCRLALDHPLANLRQVLLRRRRHDAQLGRMEKERQDDLRDRIRRTYRSAIIGKRGRRCTWSLRLAARLREPGS